ncbi:MAG: hypothetical protein ACKOHK_09660, partial [Planctomycetia bacterium]
MADVKKLPARRDVAVGDTWDLASLCASDAAWEEALAVWEERIPQIGAYQGTLATCWKRPTIRWESAAPRSSLTRSIAYVPRRSPSRSKANSCSRHSAS